MASSSKKNPKKFRRANSNRRARRINFPEAESPPTQDESTRRKIAATLAILIAIALGGFYLAVLNFAANPRVDDSYRAYFIERRTATMGDFLRRYRNCLVAMVGVGDSRSGISRAALKELRNWRSEIAEMRPGENYAALFFRGRLVAEKISASPIQIALPKEAKLADDFALSDTLILFSGGGIGKALRGGKDGIQNSPLPNTMHIAVFDDELRQLALGRFASVSRDRDLAYLPPADSCGG